eukprot:CAMPEP_0184288912 /NCGR_PEP_ID=MMETSP1049-20130417/1420_1 /TAXON_ID=77928 /ORGANISM="Proteomonas sulcata, Strain CCMP704" /LENGTH=202 /DNA_ID=CAMNT_0026595517 /DNA_START=184 /DNA_END=792 /DNA_ORIENTATION=-
MATPGNIGEKPRTPYLGSTELGERTCPQGHKLKGIVTPADGWGCDICFARDVPKGTAMQGCKICRWVCCTNCYKTPLGLPDAARADTLPRNELSSRAPKNGTAPGRRRESDHSASATEPATTSMKETEQLASLTVSNPEPPSSAKGSVNGSNANRLSQSSKSEEGPVKNLGDGLMENLGSLLGGGQQRFSIPTLPSRGNSQG